MPEELDTYVEPIEFQLLGPLRATRSGVELELGGLREQRLLVALLRSAGQPVARSTLASWVWDEEPADPRALDEVAGHLRKVLARLGLNARFTSKNNLCRLAVPPDWVDAHRLKRIAARVDEVGGVEYRDLLRSALELRRGEPLENLPGARIEEFRGDLAARYRRLEIQYNQLEVRSGRGGSRLPDLERLYADQPEDVVTAGLFMVALHYTGNPTRVHQVFLDHRARLDAMGYEVPERLSVLYQKLLSPSADLGRADEYFLGGPYQPSEKSGPATEPEKPKADESASKHSVYNEINGAVHGTEVVFGIVNKGIG